VLAGGGWFIDAYNLGIRRRHATKAEDNNKQSMVETIRANRCHRSASPTDASVRDKR
jgi:hypothetical protein